MAVGSECLSDLFDPGRDLGVDIQRLGLKNFLPRLVAQRDLVLLAHQDVVRSARYRVDGTAQPRTRHDGAGEGRRETEMLGSHDLSLAVRGEPTSRAAGAPQMWRGTTSYFVVASRHTVLPSERTP